ncbi:MAG: PEP-CTERM sorting domain-containing protein, partial [Opitutales bacterium]
ANFLGGNLDTISAAPSVLLSFDVMLDWSEWSTTGDAWVQFAEVVYNSPATDFSPLSRGDAVTQDLLTDTGNPGFPGGTDIATGTYTTTLTWDITNLISGAVAGDDYNQLAIAVNYSGDITPGNFYFDNVALTAVPEPSALGLLMGLGAIGFALRRRR